jgi:hypothetical protein
MRRSTRKRKDSGLEASLAAPENDQNSTSPPSAQPQNLLARNVATKSSQKPQHVNPESSESLPSVNVRRSLRHRSVSFSVGSPQEATSIRDSQNKTASEAIPKGQKDHVAVDSETRKSGQLSGSSKPVARTPRTWKTQKSQTLTTSSSSVRKSARRSKSSSADTGNQEDGLEATGEQGQRMGEGVAQTVENPSTLTQRSSTLSRSKSPDVEAQLQVNTDEPTSTTKPLPEEQISHKTNFHSNASNVRDTVQMYNLPHKTDSVENTSETEGEMPPELRNYQQTRTLSPESATLPAKGSASVNAVAEKTKENLQATKITERSTPSVNLVDERDQPQEQPRDQSPNISALPGVQIPIPDVGPDPYISPPETVQQSSAPPHVASPLQRGLGHDAVTKDLQKITSPKSNLAERFQQPEHENTLHRSPPHGHNHQEHHVAQNEYTSIYGDQFRPPSSVRSLPAPFSTAAPHGIHATTLQAQISPPTPEPSSIHPTAMSIYGTFIAQDPHAPLVSQSVPTYLSQSFFQLPSERQYQSPYSYSTFEADKTPSYALGEEVAGHNTHIRNISPPTSSFIPIDPLLHDLTSDREPLISSESASPQEEVIAGTQRGSAQKGRLRGNGRKQAIERGKERGRARGRGRGRGGGRCRGAGLGLDGEMLSDHVIAHLSGQSTGVESDQAHPVTTKLGQRSRSTTRGRPRGSRIKKFGSMQRILSSSYPSLDSNTVRWEWT